MTSSNRKSKYLSTESFTYQIFFLILLYAVTYIFFAHNFGCIFKNWMTRKIQHTLLRSRMRFLASSFSDVGSVWKKSTWNFLSPFCFFPWDRILLLFLLSHCLDGSYAFQIWIVSLKKKEHNKKTQRKATEKKTISHFRMICLHGFFLKNIYYLTLGFKIIVTQFQYASTCLHI